RRLSTPARASPEERSPVTAGPPQRPVAIPITRVAGARDIASVRESDRRRWPDADKSYGDIRVAGFLAQLPT
ncbi:MAG TPA: hypothetical protein VGH56_11990, partial [Solirubrobacteraceae bacterium]